MTAAIFLGPSLALDEARSALSATYLPPAAQGDVWRAVTMLRPSAIGIVDGAFGQVPAVWHKEILWALSRGVHVFGAASMGALRAAELAPFGMRGVGVIFEAYRDDRLAPTGDAPFEDDDEVAVLHAPAELGWQPLSEAMVDVRCSLAVAECEGVIGGAERGLVAAAAKAIFFAERTWPRVLERAVSSGLDPARRAGLEAWLGHGRVRQKRADALMLLKEMRAFLAGRPAPFAAGFDFASTGMWAMAVAEAGVAWEGTAGLTGAGVLDELRLDPVLWRAVRRAALLDELIAAEGIEPARAEARSLMAELRFQLGLADRAAVEAWMASTGASADLLQRAAEAEAALRRLEDERAPHLLGRMLDRLRVEGRYAGLHDRAAAKLERRPASGSMPERRPAGELYVLRWYFETRLDTGIPDDLEAYARDLGLADAAALHEVLWDEYSFSHVDRT